MEETITEEAVIEQQIDLFADTLPSLDDMQQLSNAVNAGESNQIAFAQQIEQKISQNGAKDCLTVGIGLYILGRYNEAIEKISKGQDCKEKYIYLAYAFRKTRQFDLAIENLQKSLGYGADALMVTLEKCAAYRLASDFVTADNELKSCANFENISADYHYQLARLQEAQGLYDQAMDNYKVALELSPNHKKALFHLAYRCDLSGDEEAAIDYYKQIVSTQPAYLSVLMNLAVLYEDMGKFDKAAVCIDKILRSHPNHQRAIMFEKDILSSKTMYYDEEKELKKTRKSQILETPISDFELSVRSRNCLKKMNIYTIGDLLNISEAELLSYKNFGETSLREIKIILDSKNLHLGISLEEQQFSAGMSDLVNVAMTEENEQVLSKSVDDLQLSIRARKCLQKLNMRTLGELIQKTEAELLGCKNFGVTSLNEIKKALTNFGLSLRNLD